MIEIRQARYFVAVAEELHFGRAAARLHMSQPPLSQAIKQLEREVGSRLLDRTKRSVVLTPAGAAFLDGCRSLLRQADTVASIPAMVAEGRIGRLRIGAVASAFEWPLPDILATLRERHPGLEFLAEEIDSHEANQALLDRRLDVAIVRQAAPLGGIMAVPLLADQFVAVLPSTHPLARESTPLDLAELATETWVWFPRQISPDYHDAMAAACRRAGFSPIASHWARSITTQLALVACGLGVTVVPSAAVTPARSGIAIRPLVDMAETVGLSVTTRADGGALSAEFAECAQDIVRRLGSPTSA
jgi:DNA-binding transcriptional LysR family regulator